MTSQWSDMESGSVSTQAWSKMAAPQKHKCGDMNMSMMAACSSAMVHAVFIGKVSPVKCGRINLDMKHFLG